MNTKLPDSVVKGETEIFDLINDNILDGIIIIGEAIVYENVIYKVAAKAAEKNIPVINVSDPPHKLRTCLHKICVRISSDRGASCGVQKSV